MQWTSLLSLASLLCSVTSGIAYGQTLVDVGVPPSHQLVVLLDEVGQPDWTPEAVVASIGADNPSDPMRTRLQNPVHADFLITKLRTPAAERMPRPREDALAQLERYVVLSYSSEEETLRALAALRMDPAVAAATRNVNMQSFVQPADPEFAVVAGGAVDQYQWGYHSLPQGVGIASMNFPAAWDKVRGTAYLGHIDFGLQINHPDLSGSFRSHFALNLPANNASVDELVGQPYPIPNTNPQAYRAIYAGHGTHVAGIMAANTRHPSLPAGGGVRSSRSRCASILLVTCR